MARIRMKNTSKEGLQICISHRLDYEKRRGGGSAPSCLAKKQNPQGYLNRKKSG